MEVVNLSTMQPLTLSKLVFLARLHLIVPQIRQTVNTILAQEVDNLLTGTCCSSCLDAHLVSCSDSWFFCPLSLFRSWTICRGQSILQSKYRLV